MDRARTGRPGERASGRQRNVQTSEGGTSGSLAGHEEGSGRDQKSARGTSFPCRPRPRCRRHLTDPPRAIASGMQVQSGSTQN